MESLFVLGFLLGMRHAIEADHVAAVSTLTVQSEGSSSRRLAFVGMSWGLGHTTTLFAIAVPALVFGRMLSEGQMAGLELAVGAMLVILGLDVLRRLRHERIHIHAHEHGDGVRHIHFHSHAGDAAPHEHSPHDHAHPSLAAKGEERRGQRMSLRAYLVGLMHGAAGSGALIALAAASAPSVGTAALYILLFGLGSSLGMGLLTWVISLPLSLANRTAARLGNAIRLGAGLASFAIGAMIIWEKGAVLLGLA